MLGMENLNPYERIVAATFKQAVEDYVSFHGMDFKKKPYMTTEQYTNLSNKEDLYKTARKFIFRTIKEDERHLSKEELKKHPLKTGGGITLGINIKYIQRKVQELAETEGGADGQGRTTLFRVI